MLIFVIILLSNKYFFFLNKVVKLSRVHYTSYKFNRLNREIRIDIIYYYLNILKKYYFEFFKKQNHIFIIKIMIELYEAIPAQINFKPNLNKKLN
jgi:hypothetical protein